MDFLSNFSPEESNGTDNIDGEKEKQ
jgi:hypothetical protein